MRNLNDCQIEESATIRTVLPALKKWEEWNVSGFLGSYPLAGDDDETIVSCVLFESKESYLTLADDPAQDEWWQSEMAPLLDGDVKWIDGAWVE